LQLHLPAPLRSPGVTRLPRYYGCSDSCTGGLGRPLANRPGSVRRRSPCFTVETFRPFCLHPPPVLPDFGSGFEVEPYRACRLLTNDTPPFQWVGASFGLRHSLAGSPRQKAESSSPGPLALLRTGRSPPVAFHLASRRRSYLRLRGSDQPRQGLAPCWLFRTALQAHECGDVTPLSFFDLEALAKEKKESGAKPPHSKGPK